MFPKTYFTMANIFYFLNKQYYLILNYFNLVSSLKFKYLILIYNYVNIGRVLLYTINGVKLAHLSYIQLMELN